MLWLIFFISVYGFAGPPVTFNSIPSGAMADTLQIGDYYVADLDVYARRDPRRGDVALYHPFPRDPIFYIDRVVGLPGDRVQMVDGKLILNGEQVSMEAGPDRPIAEAPPGARRYFEILPDGVRHEILDFETGGLLDDTAEFLVPAGHYFVLGDNRDNATDSRLANVGFVPRDRFIARVVRLLFSISPETGEWRAERFLEPVR